MGSRTPPFTDEIILKDADFPAYSDPCPICDGELAREFIDVPVVRNYPNVAAVVLLRNIPALRCPSCGMEWVLKQTMDKAEPELERKFQAAVKLHK